MQRAKPMPTGGNTVTRGKPQFTMVVFWDWLRLPLSQWYPETFAGKASPFAQEAVTNVAHYGKEANDFYKTMLGACWAESARVLRDGGLLAFTFHHSDDSQWVSVLESLFEAGFILEQAYGAHIQEWIWGKNVCRGLRQLACLEVLDLPKTRCLVRLLDGMVELPSDTLAMEEAITVIACEVSTSGPSPRRSRSRKSIAAFSSRRLRITSDQMVNLPNSCESGYRSNLPAGSIERDPSWAEITGLWWPRSPCTAKNSSNRSFIDRNRKDRWINRRTSQKDS